MRVMISHLTKRQWGREGGVQRKIGRQNKGMRISKDRHRCDEQREWTGDKQD
jgi:hypothetical protein